MRNIYPNTHIPHPQTHIHTVAAGIYTIRQTGAVINVLFLSSLLPATSLHVLLSLYIYTHTQSVDMIRFFPREQWKSRWCVMRKLSPVAGKCVISTTDIWLHVCLSVCVLYCLCVNKYILYQYKCHRLAARTICSKCKHLCDIQSGLTKKKSCAQMDRILCVVGTAVYWVCIFQLENLTCTPLRRHSCSTFTFTASSICASVPQVLACVHIISVCACRREQRAMCARTFAYAGVGMYIYACTVYVYMYNISLQHLFQRCLIGCPASLKQTSWVESNFGVDLPEALRTAAALASRRHTPRQKAARPARVRINSYYM